MHCRFARTTRLISVFLAKYECCVGLRLSLLSLSKKPIAIPLIVAPKRHSFIPFFQCTPNVQPKLNFISSIITFVMQRFKALPWGSKTFILRAANLNFSIIAVISSMVASSTYVTWFKTIPNATSYIPMIQRMLLA